ncbi:Glutamine-dependent NAD(+) synthetase [Fasciola gigantica]|uniref:Glutamine-dependent NAD(+) synthetase n=1 Tax=Fasciola gigantica TaxID=46835 RepID=A0A504Z0W8_FASGI|nr:Glutamine-dependent NAD(+) synthetase [Fasciola gigantica]
MLRPEEEISKGPALWLWDILRRSGSAGFFLCLSGGLDSASVACLVLSLCSEISSEIQLNNSEVIQALQRILNCSESDIHKLTPRDLCSRIFFTCYMPSENSSAETRCRAFQLAQAIGSHHLIADIDDAVSSLVKTATQSLSLSRLPRFTVQGGEARESLALQNVQARSRMVLSYLMAQLIPQQHQLSSGLLMLSSGNLDECLRGYLTKYDCSSADLNPIGSISKKDLRTFIYYCAESLSRCLDPPYSTQMKEALQRIASAQPTAELIPLDSSGNIQQNDEADMGLTYNMLSLFGRLRKIESCGPYSMLCRLLDGAWMEVKDDIPEDCLDENRLMNVRLASFLSSKVKWFFRMYAINRHKTTVLPPAYHTEAYNADDNRFDLRPFLYPADWTHQFVRMDLLIRDWGNQLHHM